MTDQSSDTVAATHSCDILVIGAGVSGYCAAIQAGREGRRVILLEKDEVLGGNSGPNLGVGITGADRYNAYATESGVIQELQEEAAWVRGFTQVSRGTMPYNISRRNEAVIQDALQRAGVRVLKRHYARRPIMEQNRITGVIAEDLAAFRTVRIDVAGMVVEASGDGHIGAAAGADFDCGSESRDEFGERSAPEQRRTWVQGTSLVAIAQRTDHEVIFIPPPGTPPFSPRLWHGRISSYLEHGHGPLRDDHDVVFLYITEAGGDRDTIREDGEIYELLLQQLWGEWDHIKNGAHRDQARNWDLLWVSPKAGKRESRRFLGDVILTQTDLECGRCFPDDVAYGGHDLDDHQALGAAGSNIFGHSIPPLYGIPFRSCYSRNTDNLLLAGRLISATHLAHSSTRLMRTGGAIGQAVGLAAALCCQRGVTPRELGQQHLDVLQQELLRRDGTILNRPVGAAPARAAVDAGGSGAGPELPDADPGISVADAGPSGTESGPSQADPALSAANPEPPGVDPGTCAAAPGTPPGAPGPSDADQELAVADSVSSGEDWGAPAAAPGSPGAGHRSPGSAPRTSDAAPGASIAGFLPPVTDLAPFARITASSELRFEDQTVHTFAPLVAPAGNLLWDWPRRLEHVELCLRNTDTATRPVCVTVWRARREPRWTTAEQHSEHGWNDLNDSAFEQVAQLGGRVPAGFEGWCRVEGLVELPAKDPAADADRLLVTLNEDQHLWWGLVEPTCELCEMVEHSHHQPHWTPVRARGSMRFQDELPLGQARQVTDGFHRRFSRGPTHLWMTPADVAPPHELVLTWDQTTPIGRVEIQFDNLPPTRAESPWEAGLRVHPMLVREYTLDLGNGGQWSTVVAETGNIHRFRVHSFAPQSADQVRLRILATHGDGGQARVYRVAVFAS
jgi:hypothetical protein